MIHHRLDEKKPSPLGGELSTHPARLLFAFYFFFRIFFASSVLNRVEL